MPPHGRGLVAAVVAALFALLLATPARAGLLDAKTDALRKAVQALPAETVAAALAAASEAVDIKALLTNGTAHATVTGGGREGKAAALPHPVAKLLQHVAGVEAWKAEELASLAIVFAQSVEPDPQPAVPVQPTGTRTTAELVAETTPDADADAAAFGKAAPHQAGLVRPPLPPNPPGTKIVWDEAAWAWKIVRLTAAEKAVRRAEAAAGATGKAAAAVAKEAEAEEEEDEPEPAASWPGAAGPVSPDTLSPPMADRVATLQKKYGLPYEAAMAAVAATPSSTAKVAYVWYLLNTEAADAPITRNNWVVPSVPAAEPVQDTTPPAAVTDGAPRGRGLLQTSPAITLWNGNYYYQGAFNGHAARPPDNAVAVGGGYLLQATNSFYTVRNATSGANLTSTISLQALFGTRLPVRHGDPRAIFDPTAQRFFISAYARNGTASWTYVATSKSVDPRRGWYVYRFTNDVRSWSGCGASSPCFGDYPTLGQDANSLWITTDQLGQMAGGSFSFAGTAVWALGKAALVAGARPVNMYRWFLGPNVYALQPAKNSERGKMHFMAVPLTSAPTQLQYFRATETARLNASPPSSPTLSGVTYVSSSLTLPKPPEPIVQGNGYSVASQFGRMQMCTQTGYRPAANAPLLCTTDIACQFSGSSASTTCLYVGTFTPTASSVTIKSRAAVGYASKHTTAGALAADTTGRAGIVATGVGRSSASTQQLVTLFCRFNYTSGTVTQALVAPKNNRWLYQFNDPTGRIGDYSDATLDASGTFYGAAEYGFNSSGWGTNWATMIWQTKLV